MDKQLESDLAVIESQTDQIKQELVDTLFKAHDDGFGDELNEAIEKVIEVLHHAGPTFRIVSLMAELGHCAVLESMANHPDVDWSET